MGTRAMHEGVSSAAILVAAAMIVMLSLGGCAAPALTIASVAADGASLAASGKTMSDHAMSAVSGEDCSTAGFFETGVLCRMRVADANAEVIDGPPPLAQPVARAPLPPKPDNSEATFLVLGDFPDWANADNAVVAGRFYSPIVVPLDGEDGDKGASFSVIAGQPLLGAGAMSVAQAKTIGFSGARTIALCRATYRPGPCANEEPAPIAAAPTPSPNAGLLSIVAHAARGIPPQLAESTIER